MFIRPLLVIGLVFIMTGCSITVPKGETMSQITPSSSSLPRFENPSAPTEAEITELTLLAQSTYARLTTELGTIDIELYPESAPIHVTNFLKLAQAGFYNGLNFHRVEPGFVVQGGDPNGDGTGGPGYEIPAEFNDRPHVLGTLAMARSSDPDSAGSQFYFTLAAQPGLDGNYTVFGQAVTGLDLLPKITHGTKITSISVVPRS